MMKPEYYVSAYSLGGTDIIIKIENRNSMATLDEDVALFKEIRELVEKHGKA